MPIFELPLALLPGEQLPLHIFEERYKRMIGRSVDEGEPFGIVLRDDDGARSVGCTARVEEVLERFDTATGSRGQDRGGYRAEFLSLVQRAMSLGVSLGTAPGR